MAKAELAVGTSWCLAILVTRGIFVNRIIIGNFSLCQRHRFWWISVRKALKGKYHGVYEKCEIRPSLCNKIILEQREERNQLSSRQEQLLLSSTAF